MYFSLERITINIFLYDKIKQGYKQNRKLHNLNQLLNILSIILIPKCIQN